MWCGFHCFRYPGYRQSAFVYFPGNVCLAVRYILASSGSIVWPTLRRHQTKRSDSSQQNCLCWKTVKHHANKRTSFVESYRSSNHFKRRDSTNRFSWIGSFGVITPSDLSQQKQFGEIDRIVWSESVLSPSFIIDPTLYKKLRNKSHDHQ